MVTPLSYYQSYHPFGVLSEFHGIRIHLRVISIIEWRYWDCYQELRISIELGYFLNEVFKEFSLNVILLYQLIRYHLDKFSPADCSMIAQIV